MPSSPDPKEYHEIWSTAADKKDAILKLLDRYPDGLSRRVIRSKLALYSAQATALLEELIAEKKVYADHRTAGVHRQGGTGKKGIITPRILYKLTQRYRKGLVK